MNTLHSTIRSLYLLMALAMAQAGSAATIYVWNVASPGANNWNVPVNWTPSGAAPAAGDTAIFGATGVSTALGTVNNVVSVDTTVGTLQFTNTTPGQFHVTQIPAGVTLSVTANYTVGGQGNIDGLRTTSVMTGGGTLLVTAPTFIIGDNGLTAVCLGTNDLSGLSNFVYNATTGTMLIGWNQNRSAGALFLAAASNNITAGTISQGAGGSSNGGNCDMNLGPGTNVINVGTHNVIAQKASGSLKFATANGGLRLRGLGGTDADRATMVVGNRNATGTGTTTGSVSVNDHVVDMKLATLTVGQETGNAAVNGIGNFSFNAGTVDATAVNIANCSGNAGATATGTINVGASGALGTSGLLTVATSISLGNLSSGTNATATLNIIGGTVICTNSLAKVSTLNTTGTVAVTTGTLYVQGAIGNPANPIDKFSLTNATLRLKVDASGSITTNAVVGNLNAIGTTTIDIAQAIGLSGPVTIPLIAYTNFTGTVAGNFALTLPDGYIGSLVDNSAQQRIDLNLAPSVIVVPVVWTGATNGDWDTSTTNWSISGVPTVYADNTSVVFDDAAATSTVTLTGTRSPASMVMSNSALNYSFVGSGNLDGTNSLTIKGSRTTVLDNAGSNSFSGGITISLGTLQVGNNDTLGNLPGGQSVLNNGALMYRRTDDVTNNNSITGSGTLTQAGGGTLTLAGGNAYGATTISAGVIQVGAGGTSGSLGNGSVTNNGALLLNRSDTVTVGNIIAGPGSVTKNNNNTLTLSGASSYGGGLTVNAGTLRLGNVTAGGTGVMTVNPGGTLVLGAVNTNPVVLAGGTLGTSATLNPTPMDLTAAASTTSTFYMADPQNLAAPTDGIEVNFTNGTWHGSGTVIVATVFNDASADSGNGLRLRGTGVSDFSGTIILSNRVKGELQTTVAGPFSPAGTGKLVIYGGVLTNNTLTGTFSELNLRNQGAGNTVLGNDVELAGTGFATLDPLGAAPAGSTVTMGNLRIGVGQELGVNVNGTGPDHPVVFQSVTLTGNATFSPKTSGWNTAPQIGSDLVLGNISELSAGSSITMAGLRTLTLTGSANNYSGSTLVNAGTLALAGSGTIAASPTIIVAAGATLDVSARTDGTLALGSIQTLSGNGTVKGTLAISGTLSPGSSVGALTNLGPVILNGGGTYNWQVSDAVGAPGAGWDWLNITGGIDVQASSGNPFFFNIISLAGATAGPAANFDNNTNYTWSIGSTTDSVTNFSANKFQINYQTVSNDLAGGFFYVAPGSLVLGFTNNHGPVANLMTVSRPPGMSFEVSLTDLATNWVDADGDVITLLSLAASSTNGLNNVTNDGTHIHYSPGVGGDVTDAIPYVIRDQRSTYRSGDTIRTNQGMILVTIGTATNTLNIVGIKTLDDGNKQLTLAGVPGQTYLVQGATNLVPPVNWTTLDTNVAGLDGLWIFTDLNATNFTSRFYRTATP